MFKSLKLEALETDVFVLGCAHFGHNRDFLYGKRLNDDGKPFKDVLEHDSVGIRRWNERCNNKTSLIFSLGDFCFNSNEERFYQLVDKLNFRTLYIAWGNHNSGASAAYKTELLKQFPNVVENGEFKYEVYPLEKQISPFRNIVFLPEYFQLSVCGTFFVCCHYPIVSWNKMSHNSIMLHAHVHHNLNPYPKGKIQEVSVEVGGGPMSLKQIKENMRNIKFEPVDHHGL